MSTTKVRRLSLKSPRAFTQKAAAIYQKADGLFCNGSKSSIDTPSKAVLSLACNTAVNTLMAKSKKLKLKEQKSPISQWLPSRNAVELTAFGYW